MKSMQLLVLLFISHQGFSQGEGYTSLTGQQIVKPYWVSKTDPKSGNTVISFFDGFNQLKYKEELKSRIVKPDKHNTRYLDKMLERVAGNQLLASRINTVDFPDSLRQSTEPMVVSSESKLLTNPLSRRYSILPKITVRDDGKVVVYIFNPNRNLIKLNLRDPGGNSIHKDETALYYYGKVLNVSELPTGDYELFLTSGGVSVSYQVRIATGRLDVQVRQIASF